MSITASSAEPGPPAATSTLAKLVNLFVTPCAVFDEVVAGTPKIAHWLVPMILVCVSSLALLDITSTSERTSTVLAQLLADKKITAAQSAGLSAHWAGVSRAATCIGVLAGTLWSAFVLWFIHRLLLKGRGSFGKALELAGLSGTILVLGTVVTALLIAATGDVTARPALSLLCGKLDPASPTRAAAEVLNVFQVWVVALMTTGLSRWSGATVKECSFWVFGYWIVIRIALILLA